MSVSVSEPNQTAVSIKRFVHQKNVHLNYFSFLSNTFTVSTTAERELLGLVTKQKTLIFLHLWHSHCCYYYHISAAEAAVGQPVYSSQ
jgi:hypothetical protein